MFPLTSVALQVTVIVFPAVIALPVVTVNVTSSPKLSTAETPNNNAFTSSSVLISAFSLLRVITGKP